ncbi:MAG: hypothetical protein WAL83_06180 [Arenicellales bacterium]
MSCAHASRSRDQLLDFIWDDGLYERDEWVVPSGLPKDGIEAAKKFVRFSTDTRQLTVQARLIVYAPPRRSSIPLIATYHRSQLVRAAQSLGVHPVTVLFRITLPLMFPGDFSGACARS